MGNSEWTFLYTMEASRALVGWGAISSERLTWVLDGESHAEIMNLPCHLITLSMGSPLVSTDGLSLRHGGISLRKLPEGNYSIGDCLSGRATSMGFGQIRSDPCGCGNII